VTVLLHQRHNPQSSRPQEVPAQLIEIGANLASHRGVRGLPTLTPSCKDRTAMDASLYFRLIDRIDGAASREELAAIVADIERTQPHAIERRALERRMNRRELALEASAAR